MGLGLVSESRQPVLEVLSQGAVILDGQVVPIVAQLVHRALEERRRDGAVALPLVDAVERRLLEAAALMSAGGHADVRELGVSRDSHRAGGAVGTAEVGRLLGLSARQAQRLALRVGAQRGPRGTWLFDRADVEALMAERNRDG